MFRIALILAFVIGLAVHASACPVNTQAGCVQQQPSYAPSCGQAFAPAPVYHAPLFQFTPVYQQPAIVLQQNIRHKDKGRLFDLQPRQRSVQVQKTVVRNR